MRNSLLAKENQDSKTFHVLVGNITYNIYIIKLPSLYLFYSPFINYLSNSFPVCTVLMITNFNNFNITWIKIHNLLKQILNHLVHFDSFHCPLYITLKWKFQVYGFCFSFRIFPKKKFQTSRIVKLKLYKTYFPLYYFFTYKTIMPTSIAPRV